MEFHSLNVEWIKHCKQCVFCVDHIQISHSRTEAVYSIFHFHLNFHCDAYSENALLVTTKYAYVIF